MVEGSREKLPEKPAPVTQQQVPQNKVKASLTAEHSTVFLFSRGRPVVDGDTTQSTPW